MKNNKFSNTRLYEIETIDEFFARKQSLVNCTIQNIDFSGMEIPWHEYKINNTVFLGCRFYSFDNETDLRRKGALIYPEIKNIPYNPYRKTLYTWQELMHGYTTENDQSTDLSIYNHFSLHRYSPNIQEALSQRIHDHAIDNALHNLLVFDDAGMTAKKCIGVMGGHGVLRTDAFYEKTALITKLLAENDYFVVSGGGPGIMEAANLGAYFAGKPKDQLSDAIQILRAAPSYKDKNYIEQAKQVLEKYAKGEDNLAIPTWFYGHEPSNLFASHIAKYFSNSIREDTLLAVCLYGVIYAPGSAGTTQEIFMDATQNHYGTFGYYSPMVFLGKERYQINTLIYPLLQQLSYNRKYHKFLYLSDEPEEITGFILKHPPEKA